MCLYKKNIQCAVAPCVAYLLPELEHDRLKPVQPGDYIVRIILVLDHQHACSALASRVQRFWQVRLDSVNRTALHWVMFGPRRVVVFLWVIR